MHAKALKVTMEKIADATDLPLSTVRRHKAEGRLDLESLVSVMNYVIGNRLLRRKNDDTD